MMKQPLGEDVLVGMCLRKQSLATEKALVASHRDVNAWLSHSHNPLPAPECAIISSALSESGHALWTSTHSVGLLGQRN